MGRHNPGQLLSCSPGLNRPPRMTQVYYKIFMHFQPLHCLHTLHHLHYLRHIQHQTWKKTILLNHQGLNQNTITQEKEHKSLEKRLFTKISPLKCIKKRKIEKKKNIFRLHFNRELKIVKQPFVVRSYLIQRLHNT